jgi:hypothetical protein
VSKTLTYPRSTYRIATNGDTLTLTVPDGADEQQIAAIIDAHDLVFKAANRKTVTWTELAAADANETTLRSRADAALANLETAYENWPTLTQAQKDAALRLTVRVSAALVRLQLRKLDNA